METISISTSKKILLAAVMTLFVATAAGQFQYSDSGYSTSDYFSIPEYDSQKEFLGKFVAPFLLITLVLQIGLQKALYFTFAGGDDNNPLTDSDSSRKHQAKKYSIVMSLLITGILIPTPAFQNFDLWIAIIFGSTVYLVFGAFLAALLYIIYKVAT